MNNALNLVSSLLLCAAVFFTDVPQPKSGGDSVLPQQEASVPSQDATPAAGLPTVPQDADSLSDVQVGELPPPETDDAPTESAPASAPPPPAEPEFREASLKDRIAAYKARGGRAWYVQGKSDSQHLVDDHGWTWPEINGLSASELQYLHGMSHTDAPELEMTVSVSTDGGIPVERVNGRWEWNHPTLGRRYTTDLREGHSYKGLTYRDGAMHADESLPQPESKPLINTQPARTGHWETRCQNGQCMRYWVWDR
jgi:hypothetical protein